jgi:hypothetical protein
MPFFYQYDDGIRLEVTDDSALVFLNYDIEHDIVLAEMGEEKTPALELLEEWEERPIPTLFMLQKNYMGAKYGTKLYKDISRKWILDAALFLGMNQCIKYEIAKEAINYIETENFEERFQDTLIDSYMNKDNRIVFVWSSAFTDAIDKYRSVTVIKNIFTSNDLFTIKFDIERAIQFCARDLNRDKIYEFRHGMLLTVIEAMRTYR